jgi:hypothetical protein
VKLSPDHSGSSNLSSLFTDILAIVCGDIMEKSAYQRFFNQIEVSSYENDRKHASRTFYCHEQKKLI